jgi:hypothetical protein
MLNPLCNRLIHFGKLSYGNYTKNELQYELPKSEQQEHCLTEIFLATGTAFEKNYVRRFVRYSFYFIAIL